MNRERVKAEGDVVDSATNGRRTQMYAALLFVQDKAQQEP